MEIKILECQISKLGGSVPWKPTFKILNFDLDLNINYCNYLSPRQAKKVSRFLYVFSLLWLKTEWRLIRFFCDILQSWESLSVLISFKILIFDLDLNNYFNCLNINTSQNISGFLYNLWIKIM